MKDIRKVKFSKVEDGKDNWLFFTLEQKVKNKNKKREIMLETGKKREVCEKQ